MIVTVMARAIAFALLLTAAFSSLWARPKRDIIHFKNGDRWTCEIKSLDRGYLYVSLDYVDGTVSADWSQVDRIESPQGFVLRDEIGEILTGSLHTQPEVEGKPVEIAVGEGPAAHKLEQHEVVQLAQVEDHFLQGVHGSVDAGLIFNKSETQTQFSLNAQADYRRETWLATTSFKSSFSGAVREADNLRNDFQVGYQRQLRRRNYFVGTFGELLSSEEQQLDLRSLIGGGVGRIFKNTNSHRFLVLAGGTWTREHYSPNPDATTETNPIVNSAEGLIAATYQFFRFKTTNFSIDLRTYPGLSEPGRIRFDGDAAIRFKVIKDLYWSFSAYANYDSRPPRNTVRSDYGLNSSVGWTF